MHYSSILTSMFIHGGFLHIAGNMWFLWIFGRGVEDLLGHAKISACCTSLAGLPRAFLYILVNSNSTAPTIGASGAIAGVMGAYLIKFPRAHIVTLVFIIIFITTVDIPAAFLLLVLVRDSVLQRRRLGGLFAHRAAAWPGSRTWADLSPACCWSC